MKRLRWFHCFAWVPVLCVLIGIGAVASRTQFLFSYGYTRDGHNRIYNSCTYFGRTGFVTIAADADECRWVRLPIMGGD